MRALLADQLESGLSKKDFCAARGVNVATFYYWQRKFDEGNANEPAFVSLDFGRRIRLKVHLSEDTTIDLESDSAEDLALVIRHLNVADA